MSVSCPRECTMALHATAVSGFAAAGHYDRIRPDYPAAALDKIMERCALNAST